ncbi:alkaline phosphatase family protein [Algoriphagus halophilus]|uniref:alkaline phosphatase family protein n=1 Tax=Algoriphagus halophilus TaxID=226505 RepID=UPI00358E4FF4
MERKKNIYLNTIIILAFIMGLKSSFAQEFSKPKLILQITVDQLRADLPKTVLDRLPEGGFKYLYSHGIVYENAFHRHANTETVVGHSTLATGADPSDHGMIGNLWFDKEEKRTVYNVEDYKYPLIGDGGGVDKNTEIDPTQAAASSDGRSPLAISSTTFSDELSMSSNGKSKVLAFQLRIEERYPWQDMLEKHFGSVKRKDSL